MHVALQTLLLFIPPILSNNHHIQNSERSLAHYSWTLEEHHAWLDSIGAPNSYIAEIDAKRDASHRHRTLPAIPAPAPIDPAHWTPHYEDEESEELGYDHSHYDAAGHHLRDARATLFATSGNSTLARMFRVFSGYFENGLPAPTTRYRRRLFRDSDTGPQGQPTSELSSSNCIFVGGGEIPFFERCGEGKDRELENGRERSMPYSRVNKVRQNCLRGEALACATEMRSNNSRNVPPQCNMNEVSATPNAACCGKSRGKGNLGESSPGRIDQKSSVYPEGLICMYKRGCGYSDIYYDLLEECCEACSYEKLENFSPFGPQRERQRQAPKWSDCAMYDPLARRCPAYWTPTERYLTYLNFEANPPSLYDRYVWYSPNSKTRKVTEGKAEGQHICAHPEKRPVMETTTGPTPDNKRTPLMSCKVKWHTPPPDFLTGCKDPVHCDFSTAGSTQGSTKSSELAEKRANKGDKYWQRRPAGFGMPEAVYAWQQSWESGGECKQCESPARRSPFQVCFPGESTVTVEGRAGSGVKMEDLRLGDRVMGGDGRYTDVYLFSKRMREREGAYRVLTTAAAQISLSDDHYLEVNGTMQLARRVRVGDRLSSGAVVGIEEGVVMRGAYSPITLSGTIVVDGVVASCYTRKVNPELSHILLAPRRVAYYVFPGIMNAWAGDCAGGCDVAIRMAKIVRRWMLAAGMRGVPGWIAERSG